MKTYASKYETTSAALRDLQGSFIQRREKTFKKKAFETVLEYEKMRSCLKILAKFLFIKQAQK